MNEEQAQEMIHLLRLIAATLGATERPKKKVRRNAPIPAPEDVSETEKQQVRDIARRRGLTLLLVESKGTRQ